MKNYYGLVEFVTRDEYDIEKIAKNIRCPFCKKINTYEITVKKAIIQALDFCQQFKIICVFGITTLLLMISWKFFVFSIVITLIYGFSDYLFNTLFWTISRIIIKKGEITLSDFTVKLKCPSCKSDFQVNVTLPVQREYFNFFEVEV